MKKVLPINGPAKLMCIWVHGFNGHLQLWRDAVGGANWFTWQFEQWQTVSSIPIHTYVLMLSYGTYQGDPREVLAIWLSVPVVK